MLATCAGMLVPRCHCRSSSRVSSARSNWVETWRGSSALGVQPRVHWLPGPLVSTAAGIFPPDYDAHLCFCKIRNIPGKCLSATRSPDNNARRLTAAFLRASEVNQVSAACSNNLTCHTPHQIRYQGLWQNIRKYLPVNQEQ